MIRYKSYGSDRDEKIMIAAGLEIREKQNGDKGMSHLGQTNVRPACSLCGQTNDHVLSFDGDKKPYVEYVACKKFAEKTPKQRCNMLFGKRFCNKCLNPS